jgi:peroxiredoxin
LRGQYSEFIARDAQVWVIGPEGPRRFKQVWETQNYPFVGFSDYKHTVADLYGQEVNLRKLGRMPAVLIVDKKGVIRFTHFADAMFDIPKNADVLRLLDQLNEEGEGQ